MGHDDALRLLLAGSPGPVSATPPAPPPPAAEVRVTTLAELERDPSLWRRAFAESVPLLVHGCGVDDAATTDGAAPGGWAPADLAGRWGEQPVSVTFSPDEKSQRPILPEGQPVRGVERSAVVVGGGPEGVPGPRSSVLREGPTATMSFGDFVRLLPHLPLQQLPLHPVVQRRQHGLPRSSTSNHEPL